MSVAWLFMSHLIMMMKSKGISDPSKRSNNDDNVLLCVLLLSAAMKIC